MIMAQQILVPLRRDDRIDEILPYIEKLCQPGMRVVFFIRYPVSGFAGLQNQLLNMETGINMQAARQIAERYTWDRQEQLAKQRVFPACKVLRTRGAEVAVEVYTDSPRKVVRNYTLKGDVHLIMMRAGLGLRIRRLLREAISSFGLFKRPSFSPVLLVHPTALL
jgi:hypothetical protein